MGEPSSAVFGTRAGSRFPPGATAYPHGVNFCVFSRHATRVELLLYAGVDDHEAFQVIELAADRNRSFSFWHVFVEGLPPGTCYAWRVAGPTDTAATGRRFDPRPGLAGARAAAQGDHATLARGCDHLFELHVGGYTRHPSSGVERPGTFAGLIEKIPHLTELGVTHVELLPVMAYDEQDVPAGVAARGCAISGATARTASSRHIDATAPIHCGRWRSSGS